MVSLRIVARAHRYGEDDIRGSVFSRRDDPHKPQNRGLSTLIDSLDPSFHHATDSLWRNEHFEPAATSAPISADGSR